VASYRIARAARRDIESIQAESDLTWGAEAGRRYAALLMEAIRRVASDPDGRSTRDRSDLRSGLRSFHLRHVRREGRAAVKKPVHLLIYRQIGPDLIEIVRILHERMDPERHLPLSTDD
jgi:toxin ParE1/3/4